MSSSESNIPSAQELVPLLHNIYDAIERIGADKDQFAQRISPVLDWYMRESLQLLRDWEDGKLLTKTPYFNHFEYFSDKDRKRAAFHLQGVIDDLETLRSEACSNVPVHEKVLFYFKRDMEDVMTLLAGDEVGWEWSAHSKTCEGEPGSDGSETEEC